MGIETKDRPQLVFIKSPEPCGQTEGNEVALCTGLLTGYDNATVMFVHAHELAHVRLNHYGKSVATSIGITGAFVAAGFFVPGIGLLNHVINPAMTNNLSKFQEYDADKLATESLNRCFKMPAENQVHALQVLQNTVGASGGGFWSTHPSWDDRIANIRKIQSSSVTQENKSPQD
jgi:Zn-dependent protease with chaperone function